MGREGHDRQLFKILTTCCILLRNAPAQCSCLSNFVILLIKHLSGDFLAENSI